MSMMVKVLRHGKKEFEVQVCGCSAVRPVSSYKGRMFRMPLCLDCLTALRKEVEAAESELYAAKCGGSYEEKPAPPPEETPLAQAIARALGHYAPVVNGTGRLGSGLQGSPPKPVTPRDPADPTAPPGMQPVDPYPYGPAGKP